MIKYETIISNFDDKVTLYNWLRKVEEALKNASATNFVVNKKGNATLSFSITFADGTTLESGDIVLQQGESVDGARIASGVLQLHLTNGTWLTAGNIKPVSNFSIDANQHLIVNYQDGTSQDLGAIFNGNISISGELHVSGNIHGDTLFLQTDAYVDGTLDANKVTGDEILEKMTGYTFVSGATDKVTYNNVYCGAVKNGNKLTMVTCLTFILQSDYTGLSINLGNFVIPVSVFAKLYPFTFAGSLDLLNYSDVVVVNVNTLESVSLKEYAQKVGTNNVKTTLNTTGLSLETEYFVRIEHTYLLSDNLAS